MLNMPTFERENCRLHPSEHKAGFTRSDYARPDIEEPGLDLEAQWISANLPMHSQPKKPVAFVKHFQEQLLTRNGELSQRNPEHLSEFWGVAQSAPFPFSQILTSS